MSGGENRLLKFERKAPTQIGSQLCILFPVARALSEDSPIEKVEVCSRHPSNLKNTKQQAESHHS